MRRCIAAVGVVSLRRRCGPSFFVRYVVTFPQSSRMFISPERRRATVEGCGIQYIPHHTERFVDLIVETYLPPRGNILDLGGGGLRFAVPVAQLGRDITVVDFDKESLDVDVVTERMNANGGLFIEKAALQSRIQCVEQDVFEFLNSTRESYDLVTAFRLLHFFSPATVRRFLQCACRVLRKDGLLVISAMTFRNLPFRGDDNEVCRHTQPLDNSDIYYRAFAKDGEAEQVKSQQNLSERVHLFDSRFVERLAEQFHLEVVLSGFPSTRIVEGYVLKRRDGASAATA
jgi:SAM-dependent methyltransferase